ncbi:unknown [Euproctis pseudoconspersa nucleopolyhedrovirus]|uniref:Uncharacterized protein n=1 Tax=Euproctis pseudoconspersa nucleopolyhedrovirus TaxID=307467 RepID=C3TWR3_9ABAC|nr:hypothetical protein EupsNPV_gp005 [Euproctis pseudoconspersa nucleopolyhedrovirus]ACO53455.1 unknown [Euproctis pseudoconspersa nucleopolyhedrovirus]
MQCRLFRVNSLRFVIFRCIFDLENKAIFLHYKKVRVQIVCVCVCYLILYIWFVVEN